MPLKRIGFGLAGILLAASTVWSHELEVRVQLAAPAAIAQATYSGQEPVAFAQVSVHRPGGETEYQTGRTDAKGYFSFVPDGPGEWRIEVDDEMGHRSEAKVSIPSPFTGGEQPQTAGLSTVSKAVLGLALIMGTTGFLYGYKNRQNSQRGGTGSNAPKN